MNETLAPVPTLESRNRPLAGFTMVEVMFSAGVLMFVVGGVTSSFWTVGSAFGEQVAETELQLKTRSAMDRLVRLTGSVLTTDETFALVDSVTRTGTVTDFDANYDLITRTATLETAPMLTFRETIAVDNKGKPVFDDERTYFLISQDSETPTNGIVIGRGPDADSVSLAAAGKDGILGTKDDKINVKYADGTPALEIVLAGDFAPQTGSMLEFTTESGSDHRMITITLRANVQRRDGTFLRDTDLVLQERVALRW
jgi:hypothetical protein